MIRLRALALIFVLFALLPTAAKAAGFGLVPGSLTVSAENPDGTIVTQAGSHPFSFTLHFALDTNAEKLSEGGAMRDFRIDLPPGLVGNPLAVPACPRQSFEGGIPSCPVDTQIGVARAILPGVGEAFGPLYNLVSPPGTPLQIGFSSAGLVILGSASVRTEEGYGARFLAHNLPIETTQLTVTIWGTPADPGHDPERGPNADEGLSSDSPQLPLLTLPTACGSVPEVSLEADSILAPGAFVGEDAPFRDKADNSVSFTGCKTVPFSPTMSSPPATSGASSSSGLQFGLKLANQGLLNPSGVTETEPEKTEVTLPEGVTVNPSAAGGQAACTEAQYKEASLASPGCPEASKVGTLVARTPLLEEPIEGSVYLATPDQNPSHSLLALYIVAKAGERGVMVKQAGKVEADEHTGQLTTTFGGLPPLPYSSFEFDLREGPRAPLITPQACGEYQTTARLYPFSDPGTATVRTAPFKITSGAEGGACVSSESAMPAHYTLEAGSTAPLAGAYSPFVFRVKRGDGEQRFSSVSATLPTGLLGRIAGVPYCPESGIAQAASRTQEGGGAEENASPSCPAASQVGTVTVAAGAGPSPYYVQGKAYLAGPYEGAPLSLEIITPAIAGPFDLGSVAVRTALHVDETTAQIHAVSDALPTILHGIPLDVRTISLQMDKPEFTLNPTSCEAKQVLGSVATQAGAVASLSNGFAVGGCRGLAFEPALKLTFSGQTKRLGNPAVKAVLTQPKGENANVAGATVILPKGMFIDQAHVSSPCTRVQYFSTYVPGGGCPEKSILGTAKAWSPLLAEPEEGNVYFRSNGGERELPDLVVALRGQIPLQLVGFVDSVGRKNAEVRRVRSRFLGLPDAPVSRFELKLDGGKKGLLENSKSLCKGKLPAKFQLTGQNGATHDTEPAVQVACGKKKGGGSK